MLRDLYYKLKVVINFPKSSTPTNRPVALIPLCEGPLLYNNSALEPQQLVLQSCVFCGIKAIEISR